jgi:hypothetical protein
MKNQSITKEEDRNMEGMIQWDNLDIQWWNHQDQAFMHDGRKLDTLKIKKKLLRQVWTLETIISLIDICFIVLW